MKEIIKLGLILLLITAIAGFLLGGAYEITKGPIAEVNAKAEADAMKEILPDADTFTEVKDAKPTTDITSVTEGKSGNETKGYLLKVNTKGYGGTISLMVSITTEGKVGGIKILSHSETPGLGAKASEEPEFGAQFANKEASNELQVGKDITAITGATITSKGVTKGVNAAIAYYNNNLKGAK